MIKKNSQKELLKILEHAASKMTVAVRGLTDEIQKVRDDHEKLYRLIEGMHFLKKRLEISHSPFCDVDPVTLKWKKAMYPGGTPSICDSCFRLINARGVISRFTTEGVEFVPDIKGGFTTSENKNE